MTFSPWWMNVLDWKHSAALCCKLRTISMCSGMYSVKKNFYKLSEIQRVLTGKQPIVYCTGKHRENGNILCFYNRFYQHDASDIAVTLAVYKTHALHELCDGPHSLWSLCGQVPNSSWGLRICSLSCTLRYSFYKILCFFKSIL